MTIDFQKTSLDAGIVTRDMASAKRFYGDLLGLVDSGELKLPGIGLIQRYTIGENTLRLFKPEADPQREGSRDGFASQTGIRYLTLYVANLDAIAQATIDAGFKLTTAPYELRPKVRVAQIEDADGNTIELMQEG
jgi:predicted enzyme related to lactoylglutathione lyase